MPQSAKGTNFHHLGTFFVGMVSHINYCAFDEISIATSSTSFRILQVSRVRAYIHANVFRETISGNVRQYLW